MPYFNIGQKLPTIQPFIYDPNVKYFEDTFADLSKWDVIAQNGTAELTSEGVKLTSNGGDLILATKDNILSGKNYVAVLIKLKVLSLPSSGSVILFYTGDSYGSQNAISLVVKGDGIWYDTWGTESSGGARYPISLNEWYYIAFVRAGNWLSYSKKEPPDYIWYHGAGHCTYTGLYNYMGKIYIGVSGGASAVYSIVGVYESAGEGLSDLRPIIDGSTNKILTDGTHYYFWATEDYLGCEAGSLDRILILRTMDFTNFEIVKHVVAGQVGYAGPGYAIKIGDRIYMWLSNYVSLSGYQNGMHWLCQAVLDSDFNFLNLYEDVTIQNAPSALGVYNIWFVKIGNKWYAVTDGPYLFEVADPTSRVLNYVSELPPSEGYKDSPYAFTVTDGSNTYVLLVSFMSVEGEYHVYIDLYDTNFNYISRLADLSPVDFRSTLSYVLTPSTKMLYVSLISRILSPYIDPYPVSSDLIQKEYYKKPTTLSLSVTPL